MITVGRISIVSDTYQLVTGDEDMEGGVLVVANFLLAPKLAQNRSVLDVTPVWQGLEVGYESSDFLLPIVQSRSGSDNQERPPDIMGLR